MILMLETENLGLSLYATLADAERDLETIDIDIENVEYEFCDESGRRIKGEIITPVTKFRS